MFKLNLLSRPLLFVLVFVFAFACQKGESPKPEVKQKTDFVAGNMPTVEEGTIVIRFDDETAKKLGEHVEISDIPTRSPSLASSFASLGVKSIKRVFDMDPRFKKRYYKSGLHKYYKVKFDSKIPLTRANKEFEGLPGVEYVEPVRKIVPMSGYNDTNFGKQWAYNNPKNSFDINILNVWKYYSKGKSNVIVAILDEGVQLDHVDLKDNVIEDKDGGSRNFKNPGTKVFPGDHGTHVAGVIAAVNNNRQGVSSIAGGDKLNGVSGVRLMSIEILSPQDEPNTSPEKSHADAFRHAADNGAVIAQNSWGYPLPRDAQGNLIQSQVKLYEKSWGISPVDKAGIDYFTEYAGCDDDGNQLPDSPMKGGLVVFAAGNDNFTKNIPSYYEKVIAVAAVNDGGAKAGFSNYGDYVDICAPGVDIYSTMRNNLYGNMSGTSMACPHVSGVAALLVSYYGGEGFTASKLKEAILNGADKEKVKDVPFAIGPMLDALGSFTYLDDALPKHPQSKDVKVAWNGKDLKIDWKVTESSRHIPAYSYKLAIAKDSTIIKNLDFTAALPEGVIVKDFLGTTSEREGSMTAVVKNLEIGVKYYFSLIALNYLSRFNKEDKQIQEIFTKKNEAPVLLKKSENEQSLERIVIDNVASQKVLNLSDFVKDPEEDDLTVKLKSFNRNVKLSYKNGKLYLSSNKAGELDVEILISDVADNQLIIKSKLFVKRKDKQLEIYPSVVKDFLKVRPYVEKTQTVEISILNHNSTVVYNFKKNLNIFELQKLDLRALPSGSYFIRVSYEGHEHVEKFVKI